MKSVKKVLNHNINSFCYSVYLHYLLHKNGMASRVEFLIGVINCMRETLKLPYWKPSSVNRLP